MSQSGLNWGTNGSGGSEGGAMSAKLVSGIPLPPKPNANPQNVLATENPGLVPPAPGASTKAKEDETAIALPDGEPNKATAPKGKISGRQSAGPRTPQTPSVVTPSKPQPNQTANNTRSLRRRRSRRRSLHRRPNRGQHRRNEVRRRRRRKLRQSLRLVHQHRGQQGSSGMGQRSQPECYGSQPRLYNF